MTPKQIALLRSLASASEPVEEMTVRFAHVPSAYFRRHGSAGSRGRSLYSITPAGLDALEAAEKAL